MPELTNKKLAEIAYEAAAAKQAHNIVVLDVIKLTALTDFFLICHGKSQPQVKAIADEIQEKLKKEGIRLSHMERDKEGYWVLLDFQKIVCHIFMEDTRKFYSLEKLWSEGKKIHFGKKAIESKPESARKRTVKRVIKRRKRNEK